MDEREAVDTIIAMFPDCGGGWDLRDQYYGQWHCADCGAKKPEDCAYLRRLGEPDKSEPQKEKP